MINARILGTGAATGAVPVTTAEIAARIGMDPDEAVARTGIETRYRLGEGQTLASLAAEAMQRALDDAGIAAADLQRLILVSSTGGDVRIPATANRVMGALGITRTCDAFDLNNACTGFLSAIDVAARSVATGQHPVGVVAAETLFAATDPSDPRPHLVMGDAAGAAVIAPGREGEGIERAVLRNASDFEHAIIMPHAEPEARALLRFHEPNKRIAKVAIQGVADAVQQVLSQTGLSLDDIAWVVPHQPNGRMLQGMLKVLGVPAEKLVPVVNDIGSVGAASAAYGLDRLMRTRDVKPGDRILLCAVGAGMSYGAMVYRVGP